MKTIKLHGEPALDLLKAQLEEISKELPTMAANPEVDDVDIDMEAEMPFPK